VFRLAFGKKKNIAFKKDFISYHLHHVLKDHLATSLPVRILDRVLEKSPSTRLAKWLALKICCEEYVGGKVVNITGTEI
jgi:hypothetical protein